MTGHSSWTDERDAILRRMVGQGASDRTIAAELHVAAETIRYRRMHFGLAGGGADHWVPKEREPVRDRDDMPLPAGSAISWGAICPGQPWPEPRA